MSEAKSAEMLLSFPLLKVEVVLSLLQLVVLPCGFKVTRINKISSNVFAEFSNICLG